MVLDFPEDFTYANEEVVGIKHSKLDFKYYFHKKTGEPISKKHFNEPWSIIKRIKNPTNLEFAVMDLDKMGFKKNSFDLIIAVSSVFLPIFEKECDTHEKRHFNKHYKSYFKKYLKKGGMIFTGEELEFK